VSFLNFYPDALKCYTYDRSAEKITEKTCEMGENMCTQILSRRESGMFENIFDQIFHQLDWIPFGCGSCEMEHASDDDMLECEECAGDLCNKKKG